jgi:serine/tyrosine/threonine adenylyltransferase
MASAPHFAFDNSYARELDGFYVPWQGDAFPAPKVLKLNEALAADLGLDPAALRSDAGAAVLSGATAPEGATPLAMAYAGHQFGGFSPQLGDGRALLLGEIMNHAGQRRDLHLKGSGRTPFSRGGDGKAVLGPVLREYLMGEAMHALGIPTTRALAVTLTGEKVLRDGLEPGAVLARIASSHLRVGTFQFFAARGETAQLRKLADYAIARHDPDLRGKPDVYLAFLRRVMDRQARLMAAWMQVGFVHGVMNTDNMTLSGETIDYGPCAFIDQYAENAVFSSIDRQGRYAFGNQPGIARWNLARLAETMLPFLASDEDEAIRLATEDITAFGGLYEAYWLAGMRRKLGLADQDGGDADLDLVAGLYSAMAGQGVDHTRFFRALARRLAGDAQALRAEFANPDAISDWEDVWLARIKAQGGEPSTLAAAMDAVNPIYIPRNHLVEEALSAATKGDMAPFERLLSVLADPYTQRDGLERYARPAPDDFGPYQTFCGT